MFHIFIQPRFLDISLAFGVTFFQCGDQWQRQDNSLAGGRGAFGLANHAQNVAPGSANLNLLNRFGTSLNVKRLDWHDEAMHPRSRQKAQGRKDLTVAVMPGNENSTDKYMPAIFRLQPASV